MRLTLRTMIAYMDEVLEPADAQEIGKKIAESEFATKLLNRIRDAMHRPRLGAPGLNDRAGGLDPNTVAEYLDSLLPDARIPDFEKACLESDMHLAEVASCHQILTLVLAELVEVDQPTRQRMYHLVNDVRLSPPSSPSGEEPAEGPPPADGLVAPPIITPSSELHEPESRVPEYLRASRREARWVRAMVGVAALVMLVAVVLRLTGQLDDGTFLGNLLRGHLGKEVAQGDKGDRPTVPTAPTLPVTPTAETTPDGKTGNKPDEKEKKPDGKEAPKEPSSPDKAGGAAGAKEPDAAKKTLPTDPAMPPKDPKSGTTPAPTDKPPVPGANPNKTPEGMNPNPAVPPDGAAAKKGPDGTPITAKVPPVDPKTPPVEPKNLTMDPKTAPTDPKTAGRVAPAVPLEWVGKVVLSGTSRDVLLKMQATSGVWERMPPDTAQIAPHQRLLVLPVYRIRIALVGKLGLQLVDGTQVEMLPPSNNQEAVGIAVDFGRLILQPDEKAEASSRVRLLIGDRAGVVTFKDPKTVLAIEVNRVPGAGDPETQPGPVVADFYLKDGGIVWQEERDDPNLQPITLTAGIRMTLSDRAPETVPLPKPPAWITMSTASALDQRAAVTMERNLLPGRMANIALREFAYNHRQKEVRSLAMRSLNLIGDFELILKALNDPDQKLVRDDYFDLLRDAVIRSPQSAAQVRSTMEKLYDTAPGAALYELLWKYHRDSVSEEDRKQLVKYLDHDELIFRVLAHRNLFDLYGTPLHYRPDEPANRRAAYIGKWKEKIKTPPEPPAAPEGRAPAKTGRTPAAGTE